MSGATDYKAGIIGAFDKLVFNEFKPVVGGTISVRSDTSSSENWVKTSIEGGVRPYLTVQEQADGTLRCTYESAKVYSDSAEDSIRFAKFLRQAFTEKGFTNVTLDDVAVDNGIGSPENQPSVTFDVPNTFDTVKKLSSIFRQSVQDRAEVMLSPHVSGCKNRIIEALGPRDGDVVFKEVMAILTNIGAEKKR